MLARMHLYYYYHYYYYYYYFITVVKKYFAGIDEKRKLAIILTGFLFTLETADVYLYYG